MSYIGNTATTQGFIPAIDYFSGNGSTVAFTLSRPVASVAQVQSNISNVPQNPSSAFSVNGNTITFTSAPPSGTNNIYVYYTSPITQVIAPGQGTVTSESFGQIVNFTTTGNTVLGDASTDTLNVGNGGLVKDASGNVGIGTASPTDTSLFTRALDLNGTSGAGYYARTNGSSTNYTLFGNYGADGYINNRAAGNILFYNNNAERMRIDSSGNLLVGTNGNNVSDKAISVSADTQLSWYWTGGSSYANIFNQPSSASLCLANGYQRGTTGSNFKSSVGVDWAKSAIDVGYGAIKFYVDPAATVALGTVITPTPKVTIDSSGNLLVGATASANSAYSVATFRGSTKGIAIQDSSTGNYRAIYGQSGNLYFYNGSNEGYLSTAGAWVNASDAKLKNSIVDIKYGLTAVMNTQPRSYKMNDLDGDYVGFVAQELQEVIPEVVSGDPEKQLGVDYGSLVAVAFKAIQEQQAIITSLTDRITALEAK